MAATFFELSIVFRSSSPSRGVIESGLEDALDEAGIGEIGGAGAALDGSFWDVDITVTDLEAGVRLVRETLRALGVPKATVITYHGETLVKYPVYE